MGSASPAIVKDIPPSLIGCAGWAVPGALQKNFPAAGSQLQRYAAVLPAVEINTSFYRSHRPATYARWRESVPDAFRFSVKMPKRITHERRLQKIEEELAQFLGEVGNLQEKLGCLLVQLPPSLRYDEAVARRFFDRLRSLCSAVVAFEARHASWFSADASDLLASMDIVRVLADPPAVEHDASAGDLQTVYIRLHGSPVIYHSAYSEQYLQGLAADIEDKRRAGKRVWCIFDNTASGAAMPNALSLLLLSGAAVDQAASAMKF